MKNIALKSGIAAIALIAIGYAISPTSASSDLNILSENGIHWHPKIEVYVQGVRQTVPADLGIGARYSGLADYDPQMGMTVMHTHKADGTIHLEIPGVVTREKTTLGAFFKVWGKTFDDFGSRVTMKVNGVENDQGLKYEMKDGDRIVLSFFP